MEEFVDLYDEFGHFTGKTISSSQSYEEGYYVLIAHLCLFNSQFRMLCQKRSFQKKCSGGLWDVTCSGLIRSGENDLEGLIREVKEELGLEIKLNENQRAVVIKTDSTFESFFIVQTDFDLNLCKLQESEVLEVRYFSLEEIEKMVEKQQFIDYGLLEFLKKLRQEAQKKEIMGN